MSEKGNELHGLHLFLLMAGGLCLGTGILNLYYSFGFNETQDYGKDLSTVGFSGIDNISILATSEIAIPLVVIGAVSMIFANATAWKETDGY